MVFDRRRAVKEIWYITYILYIDHEYRCADAQDDQWSSFGTQFRITNNTVHWNDLRKLGSCTNPSYRSDTRCDLMLGKRWVHETMRVFESVGTTPGDVNKWSNVPENIFWDQGHSSDGIFDVYMIL